MGPRCFCHPITPSTPSFPSTTITSKPISLNLSISLAWSLVSFPPGRLHSTNTTRPPGNTHNLSGTLLRFGLVNLYAIPPWSLTCLIRARSTVFSSMRFLLPGSSFWFRSGNTLYPDQRAVYQLGSSLVRPYRSWALCFHFSGKLLVGLCRCCSHTTGPLCPGHHLPSSPHR